MYQHHIEEMVEAIMATKAVCRHEHGEIVLRKLVRDALQGCWEDQIALVWHVDDVLDHANTLGRKLTKDEAREVLYVIQDQDCSIGVNWDTIAYAIDQIPKKTKKAKKTKKGKKK